MGAFFTIIVLIYLVVVGVRLANDVKRMGWVKTFFRDRQLRSRGRRAYHGESIRMALMLIWPKLMCRLGRHQHSEQMKYLQRLEPGTVLTCERWFCAEFQSANA